jgi:hypothetical protein
MLAQQLPRKEPDYFVAAVAIANGNFTTWFLHPIWNSGARFAIR